MDVWKGLYDNFNQSMRKDQLLKRQIARKALDLPAEDDMNIDASRSYYGEHWAVGLLKTALLASGLGAAGYYASALYQPKVEKAKPIQIAPAEPIEHVDRDTRYNLRFDD